MLQMNLFSNIISSFVHYSQKKSPRTDITGWPKKFGTIILYALTLPNINNRFSKLFHSQNQEKIYNNAITKDPTKRQVCRYTTLWNVGFSLIAPLVSGVAGWVRRPAARWTHWTFDV